MTNIWDKFINILSQMLENAEALLALSKEKRLVLTNTSKTDVDALINITKKEEIFVLKLNKLEKERLCVAAEIASLVGDRAASDLVKSISQIKGLAEREHSRRIEEIGERLKKCVNEIVICNELNSKLITQYLEFLEFNINVLSVASCEQTYSTNQQSDNQVRRRTLLNAEA